MRNLLQKADFHTGIYFHIHYSYMDFYQPTYIKIHFLSAFRLQFMNSFNVNSTFGIVAHTCVKLRHSKKCVFIILLNRYTGFIQLLLGFPIFHSSIVCRFFIRLCKNFSLMWSENSEKLSFTSDGICLAQFFWRYSVSA